MSTVAVPQSFDYPQGHVEGEVELKRSDIEWVRPTVGGTVLLGALLILSGKRKAGLVVTAAGAALALLEEQDAIRTLWNSLPGYFDDAQRLLDQAQHAIDDLSAKREKVRAIFGR